MEEQFMTIHDNPFSMLTCVVSICRSHSIQHMAPVGSRPSPEVSNYRWPCAAGPVPVPVADLKMVDMDARETWINVRVAAGDTTFLYY